MKNLNQTDHDIIEYLISLVEHSGEKDGNLYAVDMEGTESSLLTDGQGLQTARYLKKFVDRMPGGFFAYYADEEEELIYANEAMIRLFNCDTMEEFRRYTGNSFRGIVHPDDREAVEQSIRQQMIHNDNYLDYVEYRIIPKGGGIRWIDDYGHFIHSEIAGDIFYVFVGDATEKKLHQQEEKESFIRETSKKESQLQMRIEEYDYKLQMNRQELLRRLEIIEGLSIDYESIFYAEPEYDRITAYRLSKRAQKLFPGEGQGYPFTGYDREYIRRWVHPDDHALLEGVSNPVYIREKLVAEKFIYINYRILEGEEPVYVQLRVVDVSENGDASQAVFGYRSIDREMKKEISQKQMLGEALHEAKLANNAKNRFLSNMSHDIRTPMNAIVGYTALARRHLKDEGKAAGYLDMISAFSNQLLQLLNDVLEISKLESAQTQTEEKEISLINILQEIKGRAFPRAEAKKIAVILDISGLKHPVVLADGEKIARILSCLVDNALKYTEEGGCIRIAAIEPEEWKEGYTSYQFWVEDNGIGIDQDFLEHIFEPFEREKNTTLSKVHGTGLGLTITRKLVDMMGGNIHADSAVGEGTKFTVSLPLRVGGKQDAPEGAGMAREEKPQHADSKRVLLVDDNEINLEIENEMLQDAGFLVDTAMDGSLALERIKASRPGEYDLILMDIQMPVMDGYRAARAIRGIENPLLANIPIIAVSANAFEEDRKKSLESGMNAHLPKPLDMELLFDVIDRILDKNPSVLPEAFTKSQTYG